MTAMHTAASCQITLRAETAADLMTTNLTSISEDATVQEAIALLTDRGFSAAPVIDEAGRPVGVVSRGDILVHDREKTRGESYFEIADLATTREHVPAGFQVEAVDRTRVRDIMTPAVFSVAPETPAARVIEELVSLKVHRLFVVDDDGTLVGVVSALDVLRHLRV